jgi:hypothetical protein
MRVGRGDGPSAGQAQREHLDLQPAPEGDPARDDADDRRTPARTATWIRSSQRIDPAEREAPRQRDAVIERRDPGERLEEERQLLDREERAAEQEQRRDAEAEQGMLKPPSDFCVAVKAMIGAANERRSGRRPAPPAPRAASRGPEATITRRTGRTAGRPEGDPHQVADEQVVAPIGVLSAAWYVLSH